MIMNRSDSYTVQYRTHAARIAAVGNAPIVLHGVYQCTTCAPHDYLIPFVVTKESDVGSLLCSVRSPV